MTIDPIFQTSLSRYLTSDLLEQLPDAQALTTAIRRLNSLYQALTSFLPLYIADNEALLDTDHGALRPGTFVFADVSGFTALSEKLQLRGGKEGAETMTDIINQYFGTMLDILAKSNGQLLKFAGDALLTFFPAVAGDDEAPQAIRTGLRMQRAMKDFQPIQNDRLAEMYGEQQFELTMSIGICRGKLFEAVIGNTEQRDHVIQGDLPGLAMAAEGAGERDDVIIDAELQAAYAHLFATEPAGDGFYRVIDNFGDNLDDYEFVVPRRRRAQVTALFDFEEANLTDDLRRQYDRVSTVARFVAPQVVERLALSSDYRIVPSNHLATVIFAHFTGFDDLLQKWGDEHLPLVVSLLDRYYSLLQRTISANGGSLTRSDPYRRGVKLLIIFGAPITHADDPERAVTTALEMNRQLALFNARLREELPDKLQQAEPFITQCIGIANGPIYAVEVGSKTRREYTVMGDDVNLAARLMGTGQPGQILINERMWARVRTHFETEALEPFQLKGKGKLIQAHLVRASTISALSVSPTSETPFVGRDLQRLSLTYALQQAKGPRRRQVFALIGEAGSGKTRMAKQVVQDAETTGFTVAWANCQLRHSQDQSVWAALLFQLLQLDQAKSESAKRLLLNARLKEMGIEDLEPVFNTILFSQTAPVIQDDTAAAPGAGVNIFELARNRSDIRRTGIFKAAQGRLSTSEEPDVSTIWQTVEEQTSVPNAVVRFLQVFTDRTPALLVIDDVHQADDPSLTILKRVLDDITQARLMILVTYEPVIDIDLPIRRTVSLGDLDKKETQLLVARVLGVPEIGPRLFELIWERASGRPLYVEALLKLLQERGDLVPANGRAELSCETPPATLPDDIRALIVSRIDRLPPEARALLQVATVLGGEFSTAALNAVGQVEETARLAVTLGELCKAQLIEQQPGDTYRFRHGLTRLAVYESLNRLQRQKLHRDSAEFWSHQPEPDSHLMTIATHLLKGGMPMRAIEMITNAANEAEASGQVERAIELCTHALDIFPHDESLRIQLDGLRQKQTPPEPVLVCPHCCATDRQIKAGHSASGRQRYKCKNCGRRYTLRPG